MTRNPDAATLPRFVIVGGGASGTLLGVQLLRQARKPVEVVLAEPGRVGRGVAYGTPHRQHLLNVPARRMSALPDAPRHFVRWLASTGGWADTGGFAERRLYGAYLQSTLSQAAAAAARGVRFHRLREEVIAIRPGPQGPLVVSRSGLRLVADRVALAVGNLPGPGPLAHLHDHPRYIADPWAVGALEGIPPNEPVLVLGTGLTMVDVVLVLSRRRHAAPILAVSRRGLSPRSHAAAGTRGPALQPPTGLYGLREWMRWAYGEGGRSERWRSVVDGLRPLTVEAWSRLGGADRRRFLRHLRPYWDVHRHRMPPSVAESLGRLVRSGRLLVQAGRVTEASPRSTRFDVVVAHRVPGRQPVTLDVGWIVNATGPETDVTRAESPLLRQMLREELVRPDELRLGLDATPRGALLDAAGRPSPALYALGPLLRGIHWESTAVPEIRQQAQALARLWLAGRASEGGA